MSSKKDDEQDKAHCPSHRLLLVRVGRRGRKRKRESQREECFLFVCQIDFILKILPLVMCVPFCAFVRPSLTVCLCSCVCVYVFFCTHPSIHLAKQTPSHLAPRAYGKDWRKAIECV